MFWLLSTLLLAEENQTSKTVSFYNQSSENIFKGTLCVNLNCKMLKALKTKKNQTIKINSLVSRVYSKHVISEPDCKWTKAVFIL